jgi:ABC-type uncharacterized transport system ATPase subunit
MITVRDLAKRYTVHEKEPGLIGSLCSLVRRKNQRDCRRHAPVGVDR